MFKKFSDERNEILESSNKGNNIKIETNNINKFNQESKPLNKAKWLKVRVRTMDNKPKVNVNLPLSLVNIGLKLAKKFDPKLKEADLDQVDFDEILNLVKNGKTGKLVDVVDEENQTKVEVYVE